MKCVWFGADDSNPTNTGSTLTWNILTAQMQSSWTATEAARAFPTTEDITITKFTMYLGTAPGAGKSWIFHLRDDSANTAATVTISDANTSASWSGSVSVAAGSLLALQANPNATTPTAPGQEYWSIEYETTGQHFLMPYMLISGASASATNYAGPTGAHSVVASATVTEQEIIIPSGGTVTKYTARATAAPGNSKSWTTSLRLNNTTDYLTTAITGVGVTTNTTTGSVSLSAGDTASVKIVPAGSPSVTSLSGCFTIAPTTDGENFFGYGSVASLAADNTVRYEQINGVGNASWSSAESGRYTRPPEYDYKKLYVRVATAPGGVKERQFNLRDNGSDTSLTCSIIGAATTANDTTHTHSFSGAGNTATIRCFPSSTPAATAGVNFGYVIAVPQPPPPSGNGSLLPLMGIA